METLTIKYDARNAAVKQLVYSLIAMGVFHLPDENEFDKDLARSITGDELVNRMKKRIHNMFNNESLLPA